MTALYRPTREDVLAAVQPQKPNTRSGPNNPDPFGVNEVAWGEWFIAWDIADRHNLEPPRGHVGRAVDRNALQELLAEMTADGSIVGRSIRGMGRAGPGLWPLEGDAVHERGDGSALGVSGLTRQKGPALQLCRASSSYRRTTTVRCEGSLIVL